MEDTITGTVVAAHLHQQSASSPVNAHPVTALALTYDRPGPINEIRALLACWRSPWGIEQFKEEWLFQHNLNHQSTPSIVTAWDVAVLALAYQSDSPIPNQ